MIRVSIAMMFLVLVGCSGGQESDPPNSEIRSFAASSAWPQTVDGELEVSVEEGDVGADGISEVNFGSVETSSGVVMIELPGSVVRSAGLTRDDFQGVKVRVTLDGPSQYSDPSFPSYLISALETF